MRTSFGGEGVSAPEADGSLVSTGRGRASKCEFSYCDARGPHRLPGPGEMWLEKGPGPVRTEIAAGSPPYTRPSPGPPHASLQTSTEGTGPGCQPWTDYRQGYFQKKPRGKDWLTSQRGRCHEKRCERGTGPHCHRRVRVTSPHPGDISLLR